MLGTGGFASQGAARCVVAAKRVVAADFCHGLIAKALGITERAAYNMSWRRQLPGKIKIGRRVRFDRAIIDKWLLNGCPRVGTR